MTECHLPTPPHVFVVQAMPTWSHEWRVMALISNERTALGYRDQLNACRWIEPGSVIIERLPMEGALDVVRQDGVQTATLEARPTLWARAQAWLTGRKAA